MNRVNQKLAFSSADRLTAGLEIALRISECALQLSDAIDKEVHVAMRQIHWPVSTAHGVSH